MQLPLIHCDSMLELPHKNELFYGIIYMNDKKLDTKLDKNLEKNLNDKKIKIYVFTFIILTVAAIGFWLYYEDDKVTEAQERINTPRPVSMLPANDPNDLATIMFNNSKNDSFSFGPKDARATVVEFIDPESEVCAKVDHYIINEMKYYNGKVRWIFRYTASYPNSKNAIRILEAARLQDFYVDARTLLFNNRDKWAVKTQDTKKGPSKIKEMLKIVSSLPNINMSKLKTDMKNPAIDKMIEIDRVEGSALGVTASPALFVNYKLINPFSLDEMITRIDAALK